MGVAERRKAVEGSPSLTPRCSCCTGPALPAWVPGATIPPHSSPSPIQVRKCKDSEAELRTKAEKKRLGIGWKKAERKMAERGLVSTASGVQPVLRVAERWTTVAEKEARSIYWVPTGTSWTERSIALGKERDRNLEQMKPAAQESRTPMLPLWPHLSPWAGPPRSCCWPLCGHLQVPGASPTDGSLPWQLCRWPPAPFLLWFWKLLQFRVQHPGIMAGHAPIHSHARGRSTEPPQSRHRGGWHGPRARRAQGVGFLGAHVVAVA